MKNIKRDGSLSFMTDDLHHLAAAYAFNALDDDESRAFETHYPSCAICSTDVRDYSMTAARLAESTVTPPPELLKARVMAEIGDIRQVAPVLPERVVDLAERKRLDQPRQRVSAAIAAAVVAIVGFVGGLQLASSADDVDVVFAADAITLPLSGDAGQARVVWSASQDRAVLIAAGLSDPGEGNAYELWLIDDEGTSPTGLFVPDSDGNVTVELTLGGRDPAAWGITVEPDTGSDRPSEARLFIGETT